MDHYLLPIGRNFVGGNAVNVAVHIQKAGIPCAYVGAVGDDDNGRLILSGLTRERVDISHVRVLPGQTSQTDIRLTSAGDRQFVHETIGPVDALDLDIATVNFITQHKLIHNTWLGRTIQYSPKFRSSKSLISFDFGERYTKEFIDQTISYIHWAFFSLKEEDAHLAQDLAKNILNRGPVLVVITMGQLGSLAYDGNYHMQSAQEVEVVDTLGAGDTFIGTFLAWRLRGKSIRKCLLEASHAAAYTCTHLGAWEQRDINAESTI